METCVCGSGQSFADCCDQYIKGDKKPETAEALLRSRYTAYTLIDMDYIYKTTHSSKRESFDRVDTKLWAEKSKWYQLDILSVDLGGVEDEQGTIEFIAHYKYKNVRQQHHERAEFRKEEGDWYFYDGEAVVPQTVKREGPKVGRNEPCPCGSGKKFKKCCG